MRFFLSPFTFALGFLLMKYTVAVTNNTGKIDLAEKIFGTGIGAGTYTFWRLVGLGICIVSVLWLFGKLPESNLNAIPTGFLFNSVTKLF